MRKCEKAFVVMQRMPECYNHRNRHLSQLVQQYQEFLLNISRVDNCLPLNIKVTHLLSSNTKFHSYQVTHCLLFKIKMSHSYKNFFKQNYHTWVYFKNLELSVYDLRIDIVTNLYRTSRGYGTLATHHVGSATGYLHHIQLPPETSLASHTSNFLASQSHVV